MFEFIDLTPVTTSSPSEFDFEEGKEYQNFYGKNIDHTMLSLRVVDNLFEESSHKHIIDIHFSFS